ncbi:hypothetical protein QBC36DRAFT_163345, partial [Triangularia setosa]
MTSYDLEREKRMTQLLATKVGNTRHHLPHELCLMISELVVREHTIATIQVLYNARRQSFNNLDISRTIWAQYVDIRGFKYVYELSNTGGRCFCKVYDPEVTPDAGVLYILENHLGIRDLLFHNPGSKRASLSPEHHESGLWW